MGTVTTPMPLPSGFGLGGEFGGGSSGCLPAAGFSPAGCAVGAPVPPTVTVTVVVPSEDDGA